MREAPLKEYILVTLERYSQPHSYGHLTYHRFPCAADKQALDFVQGQMRTGAFVRARIDAVACVHESTWENWIKQTD